MPAKLRSSCAGQEGGRNKKCHSNLAAAVPAQGGGEKAFATRNSQRLRRRRKNATQTSQRLCRRKWAETKEMPLQLQRLCRRRGAKKCHSNFAAAVPAQAEKHMPLKLRTS